MKTTSRKKKTNINSIKNRKKKSNVKKTNRRSSGIKGRKQLNIYKDGMNKGDSEKPSSPPAAAVARKDFPEIVMAAYKGDLEQVKKYYYYDNYSLDSTQHGMTCLMTAIMSHHFEIVKFLVDNDAKLEIEDEYKQTAMHYAVKHANENALNYLIAKKAKMNNKDVTGYTPLMNAVALDNRGFVAILLKKGADDTIVSFRKETALEIANRLGRSYGVKDVWEGMKEGVRTEETEAKNNTEYLLKGVKEGVKGLEKEGEGVKEGMKGLEKESPRKNAIDTLKNNKGNTAFEIAVSTGRPYGNPESWEEMKISDEELEKIKTIENEIKTILHTEYENHTNKINAYINYINNKFDEVCIDGGKNENIINMLLENGASELSADTTPNISDEIIEHWNYEYITLEKKMKFFGSLYTSLTKGKLTLKSMTKFLTQQTGQKNTFLKKFLCNNDKNKKKLDYRLISLFPISIDLQDSNGNTALMNSLFFGHFEYAKELIYSGANLGLMNEDEKTALDIARESKTTNTEFNEIVNIIEAKNNRESPLNLNGVKGGEPKNNSESLIKLKDINKNMLMNVINLESIDALRQYLNNPNIKTFIFNYKEDDGSTVLHKVCEKGNLKMVELLLENGPPGILNETNNYGKTPVDMLPDGKKNDLCNKILPDILVKLEKFEEFSNKFDEYGKVNNNFSKQLDYIFEQIKKQKNKEKFIKFIFDKKSIINNQLENIIKTYYNDEDKTEKKELDISTYILELDSNILNNFVKELQEKKKKKTENIKN